MKTLVYLNDTAGAAETSIVMVTELDEVFASDHSQAYLFEVSNFEWDRFKCRKEQLDKWLKGYVQLGEV